MTSIIKLQAISGVNGESPPCYLLEVDEFRFLLDCGWDDTVDVSYLKELKKISSRIDAVLLSYPDCTHLGALPYLVGKCDLTCPIFATIPVFKMGQMFMYDLFVAKNNCEKFELFSLDDVDTSFDRMTQLKYNQSFSLRGGLTITPLPAGHMMGGTVWKILKVGEEDIYYAIDFNHKKERHLNNAEFERIQRPSLFITDAFNAKYTQARRRNRDEQLLANVLKTLRNNGNVLIAVDAAGRVLELVHMLDQLWRSKDSGLSSYSLVMLSNVAYNVIEFAKSQIEWMSDKLMRTFEGARNNPFQFKHVHICHSMAELAKVSSPKVVLTSSPDLEYGFSKELFMLWCHDMKNCIILTSRTSPGSLGRNLLDNPEIGTVQLDVKQRVKLEGRELEEHYRKEREKEYRIKKEKREAMMDSDDSDDSDSEIKITGIYHGNRVSHDLFIRPGMETKIETGLFKSSKSKYPVFPFFDIKIRSDEYGELIKQDDFFVGDGLQDGHMLLKGKKLNVVDDEDEIPTKYLQAKQTFAVNCQIIFIDFEGRSDGESIQKIIQQMKPRRLIITRGSKEASETLAAAVQRVNHETRIFIPELGEPLDVTTESHIYQVRLKDALVSSLSFQKGKDAELAWVDASLLLDDEMSKDIQEISEEVDAARLHVPTLEPMSVEQLNPHATVFVNELKLSDFKQVLAKNGIPSEFSGGVLWCSSGTVALRRQEAGRVTVEGCLSEDYYIIRELLYHQYAIL